MASPQEQQALAAALKSQANYLLIRANELDGGHRKPPRQPAFQPQQPALQPQQYLPPQVGVQWYGYGYGNGMLALGGNPVVFAQRQAAVQIVVPQQQVQQDLYVYIDGALTKATGEMPQHSGFGHDLTLLGFPFLFCKKCCRRVHT
jgi:hypothetical protein